MQKHKTEPEHRATIVYVWTLLLFCSLWQHLHHAPHRSLSVWQAVNASLWDLSVTGKKTASMAQMNKEPVVCMSDCYVLLLRIRDWSYVAVFCIHTPCVVYIWLKLTICPLNKFCMFQITSLITLQHSILKQNLLTTLGSGGQTCSPDQFMCQEGQCIPGKYRCDHVKDCVDNSDENDCSMSTINLPHCTLIPVQNWHSESSYSF